MKKFSDPTGDSQRFCSFIRNMCKPPTIFLNLIEPILMALKIVLRVLRFTQEWADPHLIGYADSILGCTACIVGALVFLYQHIPKRIFKIGSAKDHIIVIQFERCSLSSVYLCKKSYQVTGDYRAKVYYSIKSKDKRKIVIYRNSTNSLALSTSFNDQWVGTKLDSWICIIKLIIKFIALVVSICSQIM